MVRAISSIAILVSFCSLTFITMNSIKTFDRVLATELKASYTIAERSYYVGCMSAVKISKQHIAKCKSDAIVYRTNMQTALGE